jgi:hypothetical protein
VLQATGNNENDATAALTYTVKDADNSSATGTLNITFDDDAPTVVAPSGYLENDSGTVLTGLVDYNMGADGLGNVNISTTVTASSAGEAITLTSDGHTLSYEVTTVNGLQTLTAYYMDGLTRVDVFKLAPNTTGIDGDYKFTLLQPIDQPAPTVTLSFAGINAGGPITELQVGSSLLVSAVDAGTNVNASSYIGINNNIMNDGESILYEFGTVKNTGGDLSIANSDRIVINNLVLSLFDTGSGTDSFAWTAYKWVDTNNDGVADTKLEVGTGTQSLADGATSSQTISVNGGFDTIEFTMTGGDIKVGGISYDSLGAAQDVTMTFGYSGADADGDSFNGTFDLTLTSGDNVASSGQIFSGTASNDSLAGGSGSDNLFGYAGNDILSGGDGDDFLIGGLGNDQMSGQGGSDTFIWKSGDIGTDTIIGFTKGVGGDVLDLTEILQGENMTNITSGGFLSFNYLDGNTTITIDANGSSAAGGTGQTIVLQGVDLTNGGTLTTNAAIIQNLLDNGNIKTDV